MPRRESEEMTPKSVLKRAFGFDEFRQGQAELVEAILSGEDSIGVLPTGGGKSLCFQLPALMLPGLTLVVSPLIALMKDQVDGLERRGIPATYINSSLDTATWSERHRALAQGEYKIVYVAPERFRNEAFLGALRQNRIGLFAVDEAHCISMWGHDFRPDYTRLREVLAMLGEPQVTALTATATPNVRSDIAQALGLGQGTRRPPSTVVSGFLRPNLFLAVKRVSSEREKLARTLAILREHRTGIVYCATRGNVEKVTGFLKEAKIRAAAYHAGLSDEARRKTQNSFIDGRIDVAAATSAFGMGIDRGDLRAVIHWDVPGSLEAYYQEAGRAGRDGKPSHCEILYSFADVRTQEFFIDGANPPPNLVTAAARAVRHRCRTGPAPMDKEALSDDLGGSVNGMALDTALGLLEREGLFRRTFGTADLPMMELVRPDTDLTSLLKTLSIKAERDRERLSGFLGFVTSRACRHGGILRYFGDTAEAALCSACDNCAGHRGMGTSTRALDEAETVEVQKALSCVARVDGRFGAARIAQVRKGSKYKGVLSVGLDRLSTYGLLRYRPLVEIRTLIDALIDAGCLESGGGDYPTLRLTTLGREVMHRRADVRLALPEQEPEPIHETSSKSRKKSKTGASKEINLSTDAQARYDRLAALRTRLARDQHLPPYCIFTNESLRILAANPARSTDDLHTVRGLGEAKIAKYGEQILDCIRNQDD